MRLIYSPRHKLHNPNNITVDGNPFTSEEVPARAELILDALLQAGLVDVFEPQDHGMPPLSAVHTPDYLDFLQNAYDRWAAYYGQPEPVLPGSVAPRTAQRKPNSVTGLAGYSGFGVGSPILEGTWQAAYWSAQCALTAAGHVAGGQRAAYALCRPPGHHAAADLFGGFCYLNNAAIAARYLGEHVAILDIDYHHGNGTQQIFYSDPHVLYCSLHAHPDEDYPFYWGEPCETGADTGLGFNHNRTLPQQASDVQYLAVLEDLLEIIRQYGPRYLVLSLGFDTAQGDEVGGFAVTPAGFAAIGARIASLGTPTVIVQEGGYLLDRLGINAVSFFRPWIEGEMSDP